MALRLHEARLQNQRETEALEAVNKDLRRSEAEFRGLFEAGPVAIGMIVDRLFYKVNSVMCNTFGYSEEEMIGRTTRMLYEDEAEFERVAKEIYSEIQQYGRSVQETRLRRKDGSVLDVSICARPLDPDIPTSRNGIATTVLDITHRKHIEEALRQAETEIELKDKLIRELQNQPGEGTG
jgi:PAS domain S-box-containing protein